MTYNLFLRDHECDMKKVTRVTIRKKITESMSDSTSESFVDLRFKEKAHTST